MLFLPTDRPVHLPAVTYNNYKLIKIFLCIIRANPEPPTHRDNPCKYKAYVKYPGDR